MPGKSRLYLVTASLILLVSTGADMLAAHPGFDARIRAITARIAAHPDNPVNYALRAEEYSRHGDWADADADFARVEDLGGRTASLMALARHYQRQKLIPKALAAIEDRLSYHAGDQRALWLRADILADLGKLDMALSDYHAFTALAGPQIQVGEVLQIVSVMLKADSTGVQAATIYIDAAQDLIGKTLVLQQRAMRLERESGRLELAIGRWEQSAELAHRSAQWALVMADLYQEAGATDKARAVITDMIRAGNQRKPTPARQKAIAKAKDLLRHMTDRIRERAPDYSKTSPRAVTY